MMTERVPTERFFEPSDARRHWHRLRPVLAGCVALAALLAGQLVLAAIGVLAAAVTAFLAFQRPIEPIAITDGVLHTPDGPRSMSVDLRRLSRVSYEFTNSRLPLTPRHLWLWADRGSGVDLGHRDSWQPGEWDALLLALAPWVTGARTDDPALLLFRATTGCVAGLPDGRPGFTPISQRHAKCPNAELCDPVRVAVTRAASSDRLS